MSNQVSQNTVPELKRLWQDEINFSGVALSISSIGADPGHLVVKLAASRRRGAVARHYFIQIPVQTLGGTLKYLLGELVLSDFNQKITRELKQPKLINVVFPAGTVLTPSTIEEFRENLNYPKAIRWQLIDQSSQTPNVTPASTPATVPVASEGDFEPGFRPVPVPFNPYLVQEGQILDRSTTRIGYAVFDNPIGHIAHTRNSQIDQIPMLRESGTIKKGTGRAYETYSISYFAHGPAEIQRSIVDVFEQISLNPFTTVEGGPFGTGLDPGEIPHRAIAVRNFSVSTVDGFPNTLQVSIDFDPFIWEWYVPPGERKPDPATVTRYGAMKVNNLYQNVSAENLGVQMDDFICWPLVKLWCKSRGKSKFEGQRFNGILEFAFPTQEASLAVDVYLANRLEPRPSLTDLNTLNTFVNLLKKEAATTTSRNVKEIITTKARGYRNVRFFALKLESKELMQKLYPALYGNVTSDTTNIVGLIEWGKLASYNFVDEDGSFLPQSFTIDQKYFSRMFKLGTGMEDSDQVQRQGLTIVDISVETIAEKQINRAIEEQVLVKFFGVPTAPTSGSSNYQTYVNRARPEILARQKNPEAFYAIVLEDVDFRQNRVLNQVKQLINLVSNTEAKAGQAIPYRSINSYIVDNFEQDPNLTFNSIFSLSDSSEIIIENIAGNRSHNLALLNTMAFPEPVHQYLGGMDATFVIQGKCFSLTAKQTLEKIKNTFDERALAKGSRKYITDGKASRSSGFMNGAFIKVTNEIFQLLGVDFVMPVTLSFETVENQPDVWSFQFTFIEFNPRQKYAEEVRYLPTTIAAQGQLFEYGNQYDNGFSGFNPLADRGREWFSLQASLAQEEAYPDMMLPTKQELSFWIQALKTAAQVASKATDGQTSKVDPLELIKADGTIAAAGYTEVVTQTLEFILNYKEYISKWPARKEPRKRTNAPEEQTSYVDPDFYCHYEKGYSFASNMDVIGNYMFGKKGEEFTNKADPKDPQSNLSAFREILPDGTVAVAPSGVFFSSSMSDLAATQTLMARNTFPESRRDEYLAQEEQAFQKMIDTSKGRWWVESTTLPGATLEENQQILTSSALVQALFTGNDFSSLTAAGVTYENNSAVNWFGVDGNNWFGFGGNNTPTRQELQNLENNNKKWLEYFTLTWRQGITKRVASLKAAANSTVIPGGGAFAIANPAWIWRESPFKAEVSFDSFEQALIDSVVDESADNSFFSRLLPVVQGALGPLGPVAGGLVAGAINSASRLDLDENSYLRTTARLNARFRWALTQSAPTGPDLPKTGGNANSRLLSSWNFIDWHAGRLRIDPHVIRTVFFSRDGMGAFDPSGSQEGSFGDFDVQAFEELNVTNMGPASVLETFMRVYEQYYSTYGKSPSLAILATHLQFTIRGRLVGWNVDTQQLRDEVKADFQRAAQVITANRFSKDAAAAIQFLITKYPQAGIFMDAYFAKYITMNRVYGSYYSGYLADDSNFDVFFYPLNGLVLIGDEGKFINTPFSPSGREILIHAGRKEVPDYLPEEDAYTNGQHNVPGGGDAIDANDLSLELRINSARKLKLVLEPQSEGSLYGALEGLREYSPFGKLLGAYPAYKILIINEGFYWATGSTKLWDNFYTRTGIASIEVFKSRHLAGSTCEIVFSNAFYNITAYSQMEAFEHQLALESSKRQFERQFGDTSGLNLERIATFPFRSIGMLWQDLVIKKVPDQVRAVWQNNHLKQLVLSTGARIQVRMGYGSSCTKLPTVFNGMVVDAPVSEGYVKLICAGDGVELEKPSTNRLVKSGNSFAYADGAAWGAGRDPSTIVTEALVSPNIMANISQGLFRDFSHGIAHFGDIQFVGLLHTSAELQANIYSSAKTKIEQGLPSFDYFNFFMGLTTWNNDKNLFSVEVQEPTPWKVIEVCRRATLDFVASAEPFANRSTLFFGKPWYPFHYTYNDTILDVGVANSFQGTGRFTLEASEATPVRRNRRFSGYIMPGHDSGRGEYGDTLSETINSARNLSNEHRAQVKKVVQNLGKRFPDLVEFIQVELLEDKVINQQEVTRAQEAYQAAQVTQTEDTPPSARSSSAARPQPSTAQTSTTRKIRYLTTFEDSNGKIVSIITDENGEGGTLTPTATADAPRTVFQNSSLADVNVYTSHLKWRTYTQFYIADSILNLLANDIKADSTNVYTDAVGQHTFAGFATRDSATRTITFSADTDIQPADRKTMLVETGLAVTGTQAGWMGLARGITKFSPVNEFISSTPSTPSITNGVLTALCDSIKEMYQGWFTITGNAMIKPRDVFGFADHVADLRGPLLVKEVVHRLDADSGFITLVSPDALVLPSHSYIGQKWYTSLYFFGQRLVGHYAARLAVKGMIAALKTTMFKRDPLLRNNAHATLEAFEILQKDKEKYVNITKNTYRELARDGGPIDRRYDRFIEDAEDDIKELRVEMAKNPANVSELTAQENDLQKRIEDLIKERDNVKEAINKNDSVNFSELDRMIKGQYNLSLDDLLGEGDELAQALKRLGAADMDEVKRAIFASKVFEQWDEITAARARFIESLINRNVLLASFDPVKALAAYDRLVLQKLQTFFEGNEEAIRELLEYKDSIIFKPEKFKAATKELNQKRKEAAKIYKRLERTSASDPEKIVELQARYQILQKEIKDLEALVDPSNIAARQGVEFLGSTENEVLANLVEELEDGLKGSRTGLGARDRQKALMRIRQRLQTPSKAAKSPSDVLKFQLTEAKKFLDQLKELNAKVREGGEVADQAGDELAKILKNKGIRFWEFLVDNTETGITAFRIAKFAGPQILVSIGLEVLSFTIGNALTQGVNARLAARESVKIIPLYAGKIPYVAGIKGHRGAVIGDEPGFLDTLITNTLDPGDWNWIGITAMFMGVDVPTYGSTDIDQLYIEKFKEMNQNQIGYTTLMGE